MRAGSGKVEACRGVLNHRFDLRQAFQRLDPSLRLPGLRRLVAKAVDERLDMRPFGRHPFGRAGLLHRPFRANADELVEAAGRERDLALVQMRDGFHRTVQQATVMGNDQRRAGKARQPTFQPHRRFQVEVVGRLVQQQQVGVGEQRRGQGDAHSPATRKLRRPGAPERPRRSPIPARMVAARAGAESAPMVISRSCISARRCGSAVSVSASSASRSGSPCRTVSSRDIGPSGASWRTVAMRAREDRRMSPPSRAISPAIARSKR